ncbi:BlaI/MecI/CopY family transcriptional regulator [Gloeobacter morelensis]|uniref:BlaI/MecI/CopY family transcriptional regulator n=1 Tax=Gloeobacter morelensis MG652769 TaxID=2781736 RepID=A0ABY3PHN9_9CYAN|nr:BlaI/MecI/CopY family transcriptional regulator [Gloeobacter morelensis]UFP93191.1 BlaI/MecI/CopY family transcriptional regulator [Gloeobacter morelensis MG652769]
MNPTETNRIVRAHRSGLKKLLGEQEAEIMEQVWAMGGPVLAKQVHERLPANVSLAYSTVACTMGRLVQKGLLQVLNGNTKPYLYLPTLSREQFVQRAVDQLLESLAADFPAAVSSFVRKESSKDATHLVDKIAQLED